MSSEKKTKKDDVYLTCGEIAQLLDVSQHDIYELRNEKKLRYKFEDRLRCGQQCSMIVFNLDDVRENIKKK